ncbi:MAG TPA: Flp family type IVb pilin [Candidatus Binatia bacterium]|nr:Flp family type IVb pilin [Candidatus Binatia bacterium]
MITTLKALLRDESGAELVEYGLLASLIAIVAMVAVQALGKNVSTLYANAATSI